MNKDRPTRILLEHGNVCLNLSLQGSCYFICIKVMLLGLHTVRVESGQEIFPETANLFRLLAQAEQSMVAVLYNLSSLGNLSRSC